ncbi:MAG: GTPase Era [Gammaproteobacteria bacterium]|nr:GTPase Era [Gammaproteobacteria bacterium]MBT8448844.1 GTPase Era [Gammaproteobacteria bacterium]NNJ91774.1 GTPase Era [Gammaproteobacteria bacterium]
MNKPERSGFAAIIGRPNVGKSTLLNRFIGLKLAITSHKPQTTRHSIVGVKTRNDGQIVFVDTPGIHRRGSQAMNRYLNRTAKTALSDVDILLFVVQAGVWNREDKLVLKTVIESKTPVILVINKIDLLEDKEQLLPYIAELKELHAFLDVLLVSAKNGKQVEELENRVLQALPEGEKIYPEDQLTDRSERFFAAELIREQLTRHYHQELPYATTVEIESFSEEKKLYRINALIWVERKGQKAILIGNKGEAMKKVGTLARKAMEKFLGKKVYLQLWVKVRESWSDDEKALSKLGYTD